MTLELALPLEGIERATGPSGRLWDRRASGAERIEETDAQRTDLVPVDTALAEQLSDGVEYVERAADRLVPQHVPHLFRKSARLVTDVEDRLARCQARHCASGTVCHVDSCRPLPPLHTTLDHPNAYILTARCYPSPGLFA
eukprot:3113650-Prymnesium_polylepis.2